MIASIFFITLFLSPNYMPDISAGSFLADDLKASAPVHRRKPMPSLSTMRANRPSPLTPIWKSGKTAKKSGNQCAKNREAHRALAKNGLKDRQSDERVCNFLTGLSLRGGNSIKRRAGRQAILA
ncbi:MAG: hypothetical protein RDA78_20730 [Roseibium sp.]|uniref:hypothetical protein n=1 Tax=Roseibium sp. TaxID=1936156 RepID=UPI003D9C6669